MVVIRQACRGDAGALSAVEKAAYEPYVERMGEQLPPMTSNFAELAQTGRVWVAEMDGAVVGFAVVHVQAEYVLLENVAVSPQARGRRIGARLLEFTEQHAKAYGREQVKLYTNEAMSENIGYYARHGYVETHRATDEGYHRVFFTKDLVGPAPDAAGG